MGSGHIDRSLALSRTNVERCTKPLPRCKSSRVMRIFFTDFLGMPGLFGVVDESVIKVSDVTLGLISPPC